jgi:hypothetical protein
LTVDRHSATSIRVLQPAGRVPVPEPGYGYEVDGYGSGTGSRDTGTGRVRVLGKRVRVGYGYEHGMDVKIGNLGRQISFVKFRFIRNSKIYIVKYCCLVKITQLFLNNCLGWLSLYYLFQLAPPVVKEF